MYNRIFSNWLREEVEGRSRNWQFHMDALHCASSYRQKAGLSFVRAKTGYISVTKQKSKARFLRWSQSCCKACLRGEGISWRLLIERLRLNDGRPRDDDFPAVRSKFIARVKSPAAARKNHRQSVPRVLLAVREQPVSRHSSRVKKMSLER